MRQLFFIVKTVFCEVGPRFLIIIYIILKLQEVKDRNCIGYAHSKTSIIANSSCLILNDALALRPLRLTCTPFPRIQIFDWWNFSRHFSSKNKFRFTNFCFKTTETVVIILYSIHTRRLWNVTSTVALVADPCLSVLGRTCVHLYEHSDHTDYQEGRDRCTAQMSHHCYRFTSYEPASERHIQRLIRQ